MKNILKLIIVVIMLSTLGCTKFLETKPTNTVSKENLFSSYEALDNYCIGVYNRIASAYFFGCFQQVVGDLRADDMMINSVYNNNWQKADYEYTITPSSTNSYRFWQYGYRVIHATNEIIEGIESIVDTDEELKNKILGEMHTIRAYAHFSLLQFYSEGLISNDNAKGIIVVDKVLGLEENLPRSTVKDASDLIEADLKLAIDTYFPKSAGGGKSTNKDRFDIDAAKAVMARFKLYREDWTDAYKYANEIITGDGSDLMDEDTYLAGFWEKNVETLYQVSKNTATTEYWVSYPGYFQVLSDIRDTVYSTGIVSSGRRTMKVTQEFVDLLDSELGDVRARTIPVYADTSKTPTAYTRQIKISAHGNGFVTRKIRHRDNTASNFGEGSFAKLRKSEIYLIAAEAGLKGGGANGQAILNALRTKRGIGNVATFNIGAIKIERRKELYGEGHRVWDLRRWGDKPVRNTSSTTIKDEHWADIPSNWEDIVCYPIPQTEIDRNTEMTNADQNKGYK